MVSMIEARDEYDDIVEEVVATSSRRLAEATRDAMIGDDGTSALTDDMIEAVEIMYREYIQLGVNTARARMADIVRERTPSSNERV